MQHCANVSWILEKRHGESKRRIVCKVSFFPCFFHLEYVDEFINCLSKIWKSTGLFDDEGGWCICLIPFSLAMPKFRCILLEYIQMPANLEHVEDTIRSHQADLNSSLLFSPTSRWFLGLKNQGLQKWDSKWDVTEKFNQLCVFGVSFLTSGSLNLRYNLFRIASILIIKIYIQKTTFEAFESVKRDTSRKFLSFPSLNFGARYSSYRSRNPLERK